MAFTEPHFLILLACALPLGVTAMALFDRRRRRDLERFGEPRLLARGSALEPRGRLLAQAVGLLALCLMLLALARPQFGEKPLVLSRTGRDVLFLLDLSRSMNAQDLPPSRLEAAKGVVREVLDASPGDRVGLVVFGGSAFLQVPLTLDRAAFELFLEAASTDDVSDPGTNIAEALATAARGFGDDSEPRYRAVVLLSDGESLEGDLGPALAEFRKSHIRVFAVGLGTLTGGPIPRRSRTRLLGYHRDVNGEVVVTRLQEQSLRAIARATGGGYLRLESGGVRNLTAELAQLEKREISSRTFTQLADRYQWPLALAVLALAMESLVLERSRRRAV
jgi:Ca-activated chloride channel family protein